MHHQIKAIQFIQRSKSDVVSIPFEIWHHPDNCWVKDVFQSAVERGSVDTGIDFNAKGCIIADDMGLGKTLTTLSAIQLSKKDAMMFLNQTNIQENVMRTSATLIVCPLSTLDNWKNEINIHFAGGTLPFRVFYGRERFKIEFDEIKSLAIVLATYEAISTPAKSSCTQPEGPSEQSHSRPVYSNLGKIEWFRIVLDEAQ